MSHFVQHLNAISPLTLEAQAAIKSKTFETSFNKNQVLIPELSKCDKLYFINSGIVRAYFYHEGKETTDFLGIEGMVIGPIVRHFQSKATPHIVECLEDSTFSYVHFHDLASLYDQYHDIERLGRVIAIQSLLLLQRKLDCLQLMNARQRYEDFIATYPSILDRANLGHIASYLGMNQVTLSRIRSNK
jgi:CRP/FNR family transcriptional regulator, anaerobic regulatory protein